MELWAEIRRRVLTHQISKRQACREYEIHWSTLKKILTHEEPPGQQFPVSVLRQAENAGKSSFGGRETAR